MLKMSPASLKKGQSKCTPLDLKKERLRKKTHIHSVSRLEKGWASDLQKPLSSLSQPSFFFTLLLSVSLPYLLKPSNYSNEWLRARERRRQREAVRDWEDRWWGDKSGREWKEEIHHSFLSALSASHPLTLC